MPFIMRQLYCAIIFQRLQGASCLKVSNPEGLSWVNMNPVASKSSKLGGYKCYQEEEHILKLVQKEKMETSSQEMPVLQ